MTVRLQAPARAEIVMPYGSTSLRSLFSRRVGLPAGEYRRSCNLGLQRLFVIL